MDRNINRAMGFLIFILLSYLGSLVHEDLQENSYNSEIFNKLYSLILLANDPENEFGLEDLKKVELLSDLGITPGLASLKINQIQDYNISIKVPHNHPLYPGSALTISKDSFRLFLVQGNLVTTYNSLNELLLEVKDLESLLRIFAYDDNQIYLSLLSLDCSIAFGAADQFVYFASDTVSNSGLDETQIQVFRKNPEELILPVLFITANNEGVSSWEPLGLTEADHSALPEILNTCLDLLHNETNTFTNELEEYIGDERYLTGSSQ